jgi:UDP-N-acetylglucosamine 2-epimerase (non-hydrolysing)
MSMSGRGRIKVHLIAAARPNFMKIAPLYHRLAAEDWCEVSIIHTGQHYDANMSDTFFTDLKLPAPRFHLEVGSGSHAEQTGQVMMAYEKLASREKPDWIVVVGDVNSTAACAMVGAKLWIPVVHLEAGLRSRDRRMPEEINRVVTDAISDVLWTPSVDADANLRAEGIPIERIECIGNVMIDSYEMLRGAIEAAHTREHLGLQRGAYGVVTLHRPSNVDSRESLTLLVSALQQVVRKLPMVFAVHPRTRKRLREFDLDYGLASLPNMRLVEPLGYIEFMNLVTAAKVVVTDSGGVQEETTYLGIPCLTVRDTTERPITVTEGSNRLVSPQELPTALEQALGTGRRGRSPKLWDGRAAMRATADLRRRSVRRFGESRLAEVEGRAAISL